jgi:DNA polymerase I-like protein with 3'-5' exonuclease and polymerase domains
MIAPKWSPPDDLDLENLARSGWKAWERDRPKVVAFDTECTGLEFHDTAFCATIAWYSPSEDILTGQPIGIEGHYFEFERIDCREAVSTILGHADVVVAHNFKFDAHKLEAEGITIRPDQRVDDTEAMAHLDDEHRPKGLKALAVSVLGYNDVIQVPGKAKNPETGEQEDVLRDIPRSKWEIDKAREWAKKHHGLDSVKSVGYDLLPRGTVVPYAILDAEWTLQLAQILYPRITRYDDLLELYMQEILLSRTAIYDMERAGMGTRPDYVAEQIRVYRKKCLVHENTIEQIVAKPVRTGKIPLKERDSFFNPASNDEISAYFGERGFDRPAYDAEQLDTIDHPLAETLLLYRKDAKLLDGYFVALQRDTGPDGIFHPSLRQHGTVSGRTSAGAERGDQ